MIWLLFFILCFLTQINFRISDNDLSNPAVVVSAMFSIFSFFCCIANVCIGIDINSIYTIMTICGGISIFTIINYVKGCRYRFLCAANNQIYSPAIKGIGYAGIFVTMAAIYVNYKYILDFAAAYGIGGDFFESMVQYKLIMTFHDADDILVPAPWYRGKLLAIASGVAYLSIYLLMRGKFINNEWSVIYGLDIFLFAILSLMGGGRMETFRIITAMMFVWYTFYTAHHDKRTNTKSILIRLGIIMSIVSFLFVSFVYAVGRSQADMDLEAVIMSMFVYAGAPIINLDIYIDNPWSQTHGIFGELTFIRFINWLGVKLEDSSLIYELDLPFLSWHNYNLGNVYTTFYAFIYDFGYMGAVVCTSIMALICITIYNHVKQFNVLEGKISFSVILYAYLINDIVMLAFSHRFYETFFNVGTLYKMCVVYILIYISNRLFLKRSR